MEELDKNLKSFIGQNLSGVEMMRLCSTNKNMRRQCMSDTMSFYWKNKLKEDFHIDYDEKDTFNEYLRQSWLSGQTFYLVNENQDRLFRTKRDDLNAGIEGNCGPLVPFEKVYVISDVLDDDSDEFRVEKIKVETYEGPDHYIFYEEISQKIHNALQYGKYLLDKKQMANTITTISRYINGYMDIVIDENILTEYIRNNIIFDDERAEKISKIFVDLYNRG